MASNYPPGVSGNEGAITGIVEFDPHGPFWVGDNDEGDGSAVFCGDGEGIFFDGFESEDAAQAFADQLNARYGLREPDEDPETGLCRICGDLHGEPPGLEET